MRGKTSCRMPIVTARPVPEASGDLARRSAMGAPQPVLRIATNVSPTSTTARRSVSVFAETRYSTERRAAAAWSTIGTGAKRVPPKNPSSTSGG